MPAKPVKPTPAAPVKRRLRWQWRVFRWCRITLWTALLILLSALYYLNQVGLPDIVKNPLLAELRARGVDAHFSRLRLHWYRGIVAENINVGPVSAAASPQLFIDEAELRLNHAAMRRFQLRIDALIIRKGRFCYPLPAREGQPATQFTLDDLAAEIQLLADDRWEISQVVAVFQKARVRIHGAIEHVSAWQKAKPAATVPPSLASRQEALERNLRLVMRAMEQIEFTGGAPRLAFDFSLDAQNLASLKTRLDCLVEGVNSPWGHGRGLSLVLRSQAANPGDAQMQTTLQLQAEEWQTADWLVVKPSVSWQVGHVMEMASPQVAQGEMTAAKVSTPLLALDNFKLLCTAQEGEGGSNWTAHASVSFSDLATEPGQLAGGQMTADFTIDPRQPRATWQGPLPKGLSEAWARRLKSPWFPVKFAAQVGLTNAQSRWGSVGKLQLQLDSAIRPAAQASMAGTNATDLAYWAIFEPYTFHWQGEVSDAQTSWMAVDRANFAGDWQPPLLSIPRLEAHLYGGHFSASAGLDVATRRATAQGESSFDVHQVGMLFNTNGQRWFRQYGWQAPPLAQASVAVTLPAWTNTHPDWRREVLPTMKLDGFVEGAACSFRGAQAEAAHLHFSCENGSWHIPDLWLRRPEGEVSLGYAADVPTQDFYWKAHSTINPQAMRPLLAASQAKALDLFQFTEPPVVDGEIWGRWKAVDRLGFAGGLAMTNFTIRGEQCDRLTSALAFTNLFLSATNIQAQRGPGHIEAAGIGFDAARKKGVTSETNRAGTLYFTNVVAQIEPGAVTRVIGPKTTAALEPYQFGQPPRVRVNGSMVVPGPDDADMAFEVSGGPFKYSKFNLPEVSGTVLWQGDSLTISNFAGNFYQGTIRGSLDADIHAASSSDIAFQLNLANVDLRSFLRDVSTNSDKLEGSLSGQLVITHLNSQDWKSWFGHGNARVEQGLIWDIPMFGILSKPLNLLYNGLGNSRFDHAAGDFSITNSVIYTKNLELRSPLLRLNCDGAVDFDHRVNVRMSAELFQDTWLMFRLLGKVMTPFSKALEYRVTGTLRQPKAEPVYIPKPFMDLLHPFKTLKGVFVPEGGSKNSATNAPESRK